MKNTERAAAGSCIFPTVRNLAESCFGKGTGSAIRKYIILADYRMSRTVTLIAPSASRDCRSSFIFFSRWIRWTPPSFPWHNRVSAWLSLRVRASDYRWWPSMDGLLYLETREPRTNSCLFAEISILTTTWTQYFLIRWTKRLT